MNGGNSPKLKILLAEDDASMRRFLEVALHRAGYAVVSAEDGLAAMTAALGETFDAIVADAVMPNLTGHDLCRILRQNPNYETVPLVILSGLEQEISANAEQVCADAYMVKGANLKEDLTEKLTAIINEKSKAD